VPEVRRTLSALGQVTREVEMMEERMSTTRTTPRFQAMLVGAFGAVALLLAALGLYGALAETVRRLRREIGIRMALGAERSALVLMVAGQGLRLAVAGLAIGLVGALALSRILARFLYHVEPYDPLTMALVAVVLLLVAAVACVVPARNAVSLDPVSVLNSE
jgi:ABC-type antimicrobial peptide transport system permease subunit